MPDSIRNWQRLLMGMLLVMGLVPKYANADVQSLIATCLAQTHLVFC